jgi:hypothetical protein
MTKIKSNSRKKKDMMSQSLKILKICMMGEKRYPFSLLLILLSLGKMAEE